MKKMCLNKKGISSILLGIIIILIITIISITILILSSKGSQKIIKDKEINQEKETVSDQVADENMKEKQIISDDGTLLSATKDIPIGTKVKGVTLTDKTTSEKYSSYNVDEDKVSDIKFKRQYNTEIEWVYLGTDKVGNLLITTTKPTKDFFYLYGTEDWINGSKKLDELCKEIYVTNVGMTRSINIEDITRALEYTGPKGMYAGTDGYDVEVFEEMTIREIAKKVGYNIKDMETNIKGINKEISKYNSDYYCLRKSGEFIGNEKAKEIIFTEMGKDRYWLASPCCYAIFIYDRVRLDMRYVDVNFVEGYMLSENDGNDRGNYCTIRPVVVLNDELQIRYSNGELVIS